MWRICSLFNAILTILRSLELNRATRFGLKSRVELSREPPLLVLVNPKAGDGRGKGVFERRAERLLNMSGRRWAIYYYYYQISYNWMRFWFFPPDTRRSSQRAGASPRTIASQKWGTSLQVAFFNGLINWFFWDRQFHFADYSGILVVSGDGLVHEVFNGMALVNEISYSQLQCRSDT